MSALFGETWWRWDQGRCPCCGGGIDEWIDGTMPGVIGEGVSICGRCVANEHLSEDHAPGLLQAMLEAIACRTDEPIDRLLS